MICDTLCSALTFVSFLSRQAEAVKAHISDQLDFYGELYLVNLVNQNGYEKPVKEAFEHAMESLGEQRAHYEYFDFHKECKGMRFDRVSVLIERLRKALEDQGCVFYARSLRQFTQDHRLTAVSFCRYFHATTNSPEPVHLQRSIVRTNCMDSLGASDASADQHVRTPR